MSGRPGRIARHADGCTYVLIMAILLAVTEYGVITQIVLDAPSTRIDWYFATCCIAPALAGTGMLIILAVGKLVCWAVPPRKKEEKNRHERQH